MPSGRSRGAGERRLATIVVVVVAALRSLPTLGLLVTSLRTNEASSYTGWWHGLVDGQWTWDNYQQVLTGGDLLPSGIWPYLLNSLLIVVPVLLVGLGVASLAAYGLAWLSVPGTSLLLAAVVGLQVVPVQMALGPLLRLFYLGWSIGPVTLVPRFTTSSGAPLFAGTYVPVWFAHMAFLLPLSVLLLHRAMQAIPRGLIDAARVDGASHPTIFRLVVLPLCTPTLAALAIFEFLWVWNDLLIATTFLPGGSDYSPVTAYLAYLNGALQQDNLLAAGAFTAIVVPLTVFFVMQRHFARGLLAGALNE